jgi:hypothetical protein
MRRASILAFTLMLAACGSSEDAKVTETRMDDIDSLEGTISDEMVNTDELNEQPMVEAEPAAKAKPKSERPDKADKAEPAKAKADTSPKLKVEALEDE